MSAKTREYEAKIARLLLEAGARITSRGHDGAGHRTIGFVCRGHERFFHFPSTGRTSGHGFKNVSQRLKWLIASIPPEPPEPYPVPPAEQVFPPPVVVLKQQHLEAQAELPKLKLTKQRRAEINRRYLVAGVKIDTIIAEFDLSRIAAETLLLATAGAVRSKYEKERHATRAIQARKIRQVLDQTLVETPRSPTPADKRRIFVLNFYGVSARDLSKLYGISVSYVHTIVCEEKKRDVR